MTKASDNPFPSILLEDHADPSAPADGFKRLFVDTDEHLKMIDHASLVTDFLDSNLAGQEIDYAQITSPVNVTASVEASGDTVVSGNAVTYDGSTVVMITFYAPAFSPAAGANNLSFLLFDGSSSIGYIGGSLGSDASNVMRVPIMLSRRLTPSNASHTYSIRAIVNTGTGVVSAGAGGAGAYQPAYIRITKV